MQGKYVAKARGNSYRWVNVVTEWVQLHELVSDIDFDHFSCETLNGVTNSEMNFK